MTDCSQIAVDEAVPYEEIKQNPYVVMCSTSTGGHLSWFEVGGTRWFSKPVCFCVYHLDLPVY
jgi:predicted alpha/beta-fold hydrolase